MQAFLGDHADKQTADGRQRLVRHGHLPEREIVTGIGPVAVRCPRVRDRAADGVERIRFSSAAHWRKRDLSAKGYVYFWVDGIHVQAWLEDEAQCLLVIIGATPEGKKELAGLFDGVRENAQSRRGLLPRPQAS